MSELHPETERRIIRNTVLAILQEEGRDAGLMPKSVSTVVSHRVMANLRAERERMKPPIPYADERLRLAKQALVRTGYFTEEQVGDDVAPRITELWSFLTSQAEQASVVLERIRGILPEECWAYRVDHQTLSCTILVGGEFYNGMTFTEDMCCLPCRIRRALP